MFCWGGGNKIHCIYNKENRVYMFGNEKEHDLTSQEKLEFRRAKKDIICDKGKTIYLLVKYIIM